MVEEFRFTPGRWPEPFEWAESKKEFLLLYATFFSPSLPPSPSFSLSPPQPRGDCLHSTLFFRSAAPSPYRGPLSFLSVPLDPCLGRPDPRPTGSRHPADRTSDCFYTVD